MLLQRGVHRDPVRHRQQHRQFRHQIRRGSHTDAAVLLGLRFTCHHRFGIEFVRMALGRCFDLAVGHPHQSCGIGADPAVDLLTRFTCQISGFAYQDRGPPLGEHTGSQCRHRMGHLVRQGAGESEALASLSGRDLARQTDLGGESATAPALRYVPCCFVGCAQRVEIRGLTHLGRRACRLDLLEQSEPIHRLRLLETHGHCRQPTHDGP